MTGGGQLPPVISFAVIWKIPRASPVAQSPYSPHCRLPDRPAKLLVAATASRSACRGICSVPSSSCTATFLNSSEDDVRAVVSEGVEAAGRNAAELGSPLAQEGVIRGTSDIRAREVHPLSIRAGVLRERVDQQAVRTDQDCVFQPSDLGRLGDDEGPFRLEDREVENVRCSQQPPWSGWCACRCRRH